MKKTILLLLATFAIIIAGNHVVNAQNMLTNPGFEDWTDGSAGPPDTWDAYGGNISASQEAAIIHGGTYSANITWTNVNTVQLEQVAIPITVGNSYQFSFWAFDNDPGGRVRVAVRWFDVDTNFLVGYYGDYSVDSPDWQLMSSGSQEAPLLAVFASVEVRAYDVTGWSGTATNYVDDAVFEDVTSDPATIVNAYAISSTAMDVVYDKDITSVSNADYNLTGTASISFSGATIDGTNAKIVHLTGASAAMAGDITLDIIEDLDNGSTFTFYAGIMPISFCNTNNPAGTLLEGYTATFEGRVSANDAYNNVWISDAAGQYNGVMIYDNTFDAAVAVGDDIIISAEKALYNNLTELVSPYLISTLSSGNTPYGPTVIDGSDIDQLLAADTDPGEPWEGQLVKIETFTVDSTDVNSLWCSWSDGAVDYVFKLGDNVNYQLAGISLTVGVTYPSITGVVDWYYSGPYYRINPRDQYDIEGSISPATQLAIVSVNGGSDPEENSNFSVVVQALDVLGNPTLASGNINFTFTTNGGNLGVVDFVVSTTTTGTILGGTGEITVSGVQMAPAGTNVTITANDDASLLTAGTSDPFNVTAGISYIIYQGFETSGDTWNYTTDPPPYNFDDDVWDAISSFNAISPAAGDQFWGMQDLNNGNGGGDFWHTLDLDPVDVSLYGGVELSFQYHTVGFESTDLIGYVVEYDNGTTWGDPILLDGNTLAWTPVSIPIPNGTNYVRLRLQAIQNGGSDYAGFDDIKMIETVSSPPTQLAVISVNGGADPYDNTDFDVIVQTQNAGDSPSAVSTELTFTLTTDGGDLETVEFTGGSTISGTILVGESAVILSGVQMAPAGTNVTITATDNNPFGLIAGTSAAFNVIEFEFPELMITEIMPDPSAVSDTYGEWFEVFNNGTSDVDLLGFVIKDAGTDSTTIGSSVVVSAGGFVTLGRNGNSTLNGNYTCDYQYSGLTLGNGDDEIILCLPDGLTEIDRVEYDGGFLWPDPTATSMVFAGFSTDDNNDGTNWVKPYRREASFVDAGDNGSPGTNGYQQILTGGFKLNLKAFLEGPYDADLDVMNGSLFIPQDQPFDTVPYYGNITPKWLYSGTDRFNNFSGSETDWVLVELRDATSAGAAGSAATIDARPAILLDDGSIVCLNGISDLSLNLSVSDNLYIVVWHRNHLGIMSSTGLSSIVGTTAIYDFSTGSDKVYGDAAGYVELETGVWGLASGDVNADGIIDTNDKADGWSTEAGSQGYLGGDLNLDKQSNNVDKNDFWVPNENTNSQVPN